ncbi:MAG TPA: hypothetical protein VJT49_00400 [Amycolatopsis sp.]|nr:hypothetical protein [Amycolatopsis sp.]
MISPYVRWLRLAAELTRLRESAGPTHEQPAACSAPSGGPHWCGT